MIQQLLDLPNKREKEFWLAFLNNYYQPSVIIPDSLSNQQGIKKLSVSIPFETGRRLVALSGKNDYNLFAVLSSAVTLTLGKWLDDAVVCIGIPELKNKQQPLNDYLFLRQEIDSQDDFRRQLTKIKEAIIQAYRHSNFPLQELALEQSIERNLFEIVIRLESLHSLCNEQNFKGSIQWCFEETPGSLELVLWYNGDKYLPDTMEILANSFLWVAEQLVVLKLAGSQQVTLHRQANNPSLISAQDTCNIPKSTAEKMLLECLQQVLNMENIGLNDNFFMLGGDSIKAIQCVGKLIRKGYRLEVKQILANPVIGDLVKYCVEDTLSIDQGTITGEVKPGPIQKWFFESSFANPHRWNQDILLHSESRLDDKALSIAFNALVHHHDMLRASFFVRPGSILQTIAEERRVVVHVHDLEEQQHFEKALLTLSETAQESLDLTGKLVDVQLIHTQRGDYLLIVIHHLVVDGVSWRILLEDLFTAYNQALQNKAIVFPGKTVSYKAWTIASQQYASSPALRKEIPYWKKIVEQARQYQLPKDFANSQALEKTSQTSTLLLNNIITAELLQQSYRLYQAELSELLIAALVQTLAVWAQSTEVAVSLEGHGREPLENEPDLSRTVGWFTSQFPVVFNVPQSGEWNKIMATVKNTLRSVPQRGMGYNLLRYLGNQADDLTYSPEVSFNYLGQFDSIASAEGVSISSLARASAVSPESHVLYALNINSIILNGQFKCDITYSSDHFNKESIDLLLETFQNHLLACMAHCKNAAVPDKTAADYGMAELSQESFDTIMKSVEATGSSIEKLSVLSPMQSGMLFHHTLNPQSPAYFEQVYIRLKGALHLPLLESVLNELIAAHEVFRSVFIFDQLTEPVQVITRPRKSMIAFHDLLKVDNLQSSITLIKEEDRKQNFDISRDLLLRLSVLQESPNCYGLLFSFHHIILDGWSIGLTINEIFGRYMAAAEQETFLQPPALPYTDYLQWISKLNIQQGAQFWNNYLEGYEEESLLPLDGHRNNKAFEHQECIRTLSVGLTTELTTWAACNGLTLNSICQALWGILLQKYNNIDDVVFGTVVSGRPATLRNCENTIGLFINTLPLRVQCNAETTVLQCCRQLQSDIQNFTGFEHIPLPEISHAAGTQGSLINHILAFENHGTDGLVDHWNKSGKLGFSILESEVFEQTEYALNVMFIPGQSLGCKFIYDANAFEPGIINRLMEHYFNLLSQVISYANKPVSMMEMVTQKEKDFLLKEVNDTHTAYPKQETIVSLFHEQASLHPDNIAISYRNRQITYRELNEQTNELAATFCSNGVSAGDFVMVIFERSPELVIGMIAALKAGAAYIPLDPSLPSERIQQYISEAGVKLVYTNTSIQLSKETPVIYAGDAFKHASNEPLSGIAIKAESLAYVMYTSGSTGKPKGVKVTHRNVVRLVKNTNYLQCNSKDTFLQAGAVSFDATTFECWGSLLNGARLHIMDKTVLFDPLLFEKELKGEGVTKILMTSGWFNQFADANPTMFSQLKDLMIGGDIVSAQHVRKLRSENKHITITNLYGPTENGVISTYFRIGNTVGNNVPIGKPISNSTVYILNKYLGLQPQGIAGELYVGGDGVAEGYLGNPELTAERFISNPYRSGDTLYRTGDYVRMLDDGNIEFIGRKDFQVKIRGFRIETGEIEYALQSHPRVREVLVMAIEGVAGKSLAAYIVAEGPIGSDELRSHLNSKLPEHMIPAHYIFMDKFPLNLHGKVDRKALPLPESLMENRTVEILTEAESQMAGVWSQVLSIPRASIGLHNDFFTLGGHSLKAIALGTLIHKTFGVRISVKQIFTTPVLSQMVALLQHAQTKEGNRLLPATPKELYPVSSAQKRMYLLQQMTPQSVQYNLPQVIPVHDIDTATIQEALYTLVQRHECLRTSFVVVNEQIFQRIETVASIELPVLQTETALLENAFRNQVKPFDLEKAPLFRTVILETPEHRYLFIDMHHIVTDGRSMEILQEEFNAILKGETPGMPTYQYKDYSEWSLSETGKRYMDVAGNYWLHQLQELPVLELPLDFQRPKEQDFKGSQVRLSLTRERYEQIRSAASSYGITTNVFFLTAYYLLLQKLSGARSLIIGMPVSGREVSGTENIAGMFVNTLPLKMETPEQETFNALAQRVKIQVAEALDHQAYPFEVLLEKLNLPRDTSRSPVFTVLYNYLDRPLQEKMEDFNITQTAKLDLSLTVAEISGGFELLLEYATSLFKESTVNLFLRYFTNILNQVAGSFEIPVYKIDYVSEAEQTQFNQKVNPAPTPFPDADLVSLFEKQVSLHPSKVALRFKDRSLSYEELNNKANSVAAFLQQQQLVPNSFVAVCMSRSIEMIISIWGILKAGHAYLPLDPTIPFERMNIMLEDCNVRVLLGDRTIVVNKEGLLSADIFDMLLQHSASAYLRRLITREHRVYCMFTSGTTGRPKGVVVQHRNVVKLVQDTNYITITPGDRILQWSNYAFDGSVFDIFGALTNGAALVMIPGNAAADADRLGAIIREEQISVFFITTALFNALVETNCTALKGVRKILFGGERASVTHVRKALQMVGQDTLLHVYGPTETSVFASFFPVREIDAYSMSVPIGKPLSNTQIYILDEYLNPLLEGIAGEIYIAGEGVSSGYLNAERQTEENFITIEGLGRLYKTGDLARYDEEGNLLYIDRKDSQLKLRGYRIEPGEIESGMMEMAEISYAVVVCLGEEPNQYLCAYYEGQQLPEEAIRENLAKRLPPYMVPAFIRHLDKIPVTTNGKVNRKALPLPDLNAAVLTSFTAPRNTLEEGLSELWKSLLKRNQIGVYDNFFQLGGHSLLATRLIARIRNMFSAELPLLEIFRNPTIAALARLIGEKNSEIILPDIEPLADKNKLPLSLSQERLWFIHELEGSAHYHIPGVLRLKGPLNAGALLQAWESLVFRHDVLRTNFLKEDGVAFQVINDHIEWTPRYITIGDENKLKLIIDQEINTPFDLTQDCLIRVLLAEKTPEDHILIVVLHHIIADGWSVPILMEELASLYSQYAGNAEAAILPPMPIQYSDYAVWQRNQLKDNRMDKKIAYWKERLQGTETLQLPVDFNRPAQHGISGNTLRFTISGELHRQLLALSNQHGCTLFMTMLGVFQVLLHRYSGQSDFCIGTPVANRNHHQVQQMIGYFVNTLALRADLQDNPSFAELLDRIRINTLQGFEHQDVPFERVVEALDIERDMSRTPLFQSMLVMHNNQKVDFSLEGLTVSEEPVTVPTAQFEITCNLTELEDGISGTWEYATSLFEEQTMQRMISHFINLAARVLEHPNTPVANLDIFSNEEKLCVFTHWNGNPEMKLELPTITGRFSDIVARFPDKPAISCNGRTISYAELEYRSNQLAHFLISKGVKQETCVGLMMDRSLEMVIAILGIIKTGGAYLPIDPEFPAGRINYMLDDAGIFLLLTNNSRMNNIQAKDIEIIALENIESILQENSFYNPAVPITPANLLYVIYTSGSTGKPKGVMIEHRNLAAKIREEYELLKDSEPFVTCLSTNYTFDVSVLEIFLPLLTGGSLQIPTWQNVSDPEALAAMMIAGKVNLLQGTPTFMQSFIEALPDVLAAELNQVLKMVCIGGESFPQGLLRLLQQKMPGLTINNHYGPTETTIDALALTGVTTLHKNLIGSPLKNTVALILNKNGGMVPTGAFGELFIGGDSVARGYLNSPALSQEKFVSVPLQEYAGLRFYRTGDIVRYTPEGQFEFAGRSDNQVKIKGFRIELQEIENVINNYELVDSSIAVVKENDRGQKSIVAYVKWAAGGADIKMLRAYLTGIFPDYMIPAQIVALDFFPLNASGKIDKNQLPDPQAEKEDHHEVPATDAERLLARVWEEVLHIENVGRNDNFFRLGGDSIISIQVVSRSRRLGLQMHPRDVFQYQTIKLLAARCSEAVIPDGEQGLLEGESSLGPIQSWFFRQPLAHRNYWNQSFLFTISMQVTRQQVEAAFEWLLRQHDALRFRYSYESKEWKQYYQGTITEVLSFTDLSDTRRDRLQEAVRLCTEQAQESLDIESGRLINALWLAYPEGEANRLFITIHHLAIDAVSWRIILDDLEGYLTAMVNNTAIPVNAKTSSYREWTAGLAQYASQPAFATQREYWSTIDKEIFQLPADFKEQSPHCFGDMRSIESVLDTDSLTQLLPAANHTYRTETHELIITALSTALSEWTGGQKIKLLLEGHGREELGFSIDLSHTVGWFTSMYPVVIDFNEAANDGDRIIEVKETLRRVPARGVGYGIIREAEYEEKNQLPSGNILFNFLGTIDQLAGSGSLLRMANEPAAFPIHPENTHDALLEISAYIRTGKLIFSWSYNSKRFRTETVEGIASRCMACLQDIIRHCSEADKQYLTPSDFPLLQLNREALHSLLEKADSRYEIEDGYPLSPLQEGMLFHTLYQPGQEMYVEQICCTLQGAINTALLEQSFNLLLNKHTALRSGFLMLPSGTVQCVYKEVRMPFTSVSCIGLTPEETASMISTCGRNDNQRAGNMQQAPLMCVTLLQLAPATYKMIWTSHHILSDGWSLPVMISGLFSNYKQLYNNTTVTYTIDKFRDYIEYISKKNKPEAEQFWKNYLSGVNELSLLPMVSESINRSRGASLHQERRMTLTVEETSRLKKLGNLHQVTVNTLIQGAWALLLSKYTHQQTVLYGVTVSGRPVDLAEVESRVGLYINTVPICVDINKNMPVGDWLRQIQEGHTLARVHEHTALTDIGRLNGFEGDFFDSVLVFENYPLGDVSDINNGFSITEVETSQHTNYPLTISVGLSDTLEIKLFYNADRLDSYYVQQMEGHLYQALITMLLLPRGNVRDINILSNIETARLLTGFNNSRVIHKEWARVHKLVEMQAALRKDAIAIVYESQVITYKYMNEEANRLAHYLISRNLQPGEPVGICLERGPRMVIAALAVMKAGGAYIPLDAGYPKERLCYIVEDAKTAFVITAGDLEKVFPDSLVEKVSPYGFHLSKLSIANPLINVHDSDTAYIIYTSGSTGKPKGVAVKHRSLSNLVFWHHDAYGVASYHRATQIASFGFDASVWELWPYLTKGAALHIFNEFDRIHPQAIVKYYQQHGITHSFLPTALVEAVLRETAGRNLELEYLLTGGDRLAGIDVAGLSYKVVNHYGPTENTVVTTCCTLTEDMKGKPPIGRPVHNVQVYVLDEDKKPVPAGVPGELFIGGEGLALGYYNHEELTNKAFIMLDGILDQHQIPVYKSGDIVKWLPDGNLEFIGRADDQVKIRGFRIEPGEIESALYTSPLVKATLVHVQKKADGQPYLVAYIISNNGNTETETALLKNHLALSLPDYMVPPVFIYLDEFALTPNGKVDRKKLPLPEEEKTSSLTFAPPRNDAEEKLVAIWNSILQKENIGIHDNFFESGGHSLLVIRMITGIREAFHLELPVQSIFQYNTIANLANYITVVKDAQVDRTIEIAGAEFIEIEL